jgi:hypothetical protein
MSLERSLGAAAGADAALLSTGAFVAEVYPDLPVATTWKGLFKAMSR